MICHSKEPFVMIDHSSVRHTSRWASVERKRPFCVRCYRRRAGFRSLYSTDYWFGTLAKAQAFAAKMVKGDAS
jgi:hypothetical protein